MYIDLDMFVTCFREVNQNNEEDSNRPTFAEAGVKAFAKSIIKSFAKTSARCVPRSTHCPGYDTHAAANVMTKVMMIVMIDNYTK